MALMDLLSSLLHPGQTAGAFNPGQSAASDPDELLVSAQRRAPRPSAQGQSIPNPDALSSPMSYTPSDPGASQTPQGPAINYDNSGSLTAVNQALAAEGAPRGGMANPGLYGLLPDHLQHGTLRNALGALGDALLVSGGRQPEYEQRMQRQEMGQAMAGMDINDPASVAAATQRMAATGATGSPEMADKMMSQAEQAQLRREYMQYNQNYRDQVIGIRGDQLKATQANIADRYRPQIGGMLAGVHDPATYTAKYNSLMALAKQIAGPDATPASLWSIPEPSAWTPELTANYGMTANNQQQASDRAAGRAQTETNARIAAASRVGSAGINAGGHVTAAGISANRTTDATILQGLIAKQNRGQVLTPAEQATFGHLTQVSGRNSGRGLAPGLTVGGGHPANIPTLTPQQAAKLPKGTAFRTTDGRILHRQ